MKQQNSQFSMLNLFLFQERDSGATYSCVVTFIVHR